MFGSVDSLKKMGLYRPGSEYSKIYFPLIYQLKQDRIYNMDCQTYDKPWGEAWNKTDLEHCDVLPLLRLYEDESSDE